MSVAILAQVSNSFAKSNFLSFLFVFEGILSRWPHVVQASSIWLCHAVAAILIVKIDVDVDVVLAAAFG